MFVTTQSLSLSLLLPLSLSLSRVTFNFKTSKRSNNGTDVGSGQIPEFLFRLPDLESEKGEELRLLGREFSSTVSPVSERGGGKEGRRVGRRRERGRESEGEEEKKEGGGGQRKREREKLCIHDIVHGDLNIFPTFEEWSHYLVMKRVYTPPCRVD